MQTAVTPRLAALLLEAVPNRPPNPQDGTTPSTRSSGGVSYLRTGNGVLRTSHSHFLRTLGTGLLNKINELQLLLPC